VHKGEQIRFVLFNDGTETHAFVLVTVKENPKHAEPMKTNSHMAHRDPNAITLMPYDSGELLWKFTKAGTFEYGCLIPGRREVGMHGSIIVKDYNTQPRTPFSYCRMSASNLKQTAGRPIAAAPLATD
jgi:uncharacterized cupredoxin-like copper-binding protein